MKKFIKSVPGKVCTAVLVLALAAAGFLLYRQYEHYEQLPKFHDVTIELGSKMPRANEFLTEHANAKRVGLLSSSADLSRVGEYPMEFTHGSKAETVKLIVVDTTPPTASFLEELTVTTGTELTPGDFVLESYDLTGTTLSFAQPLGDSYDDTVVEVLVTDANGNSVSGKCKVNYIWMVESFRMELGDTVEKADLLLNPQKDAGLIDQAKLDEINASPAGVYTVAGTDGDVTCECVITVVDTTPPTLELKNVSVMKGNAVRQKDFFVSAEDLSGEVKVEMLTTPDINTYGQQTISFRATDLSGNVTEKTCTLSVTKDTKPPVFSGMSNITVKKNVTPDYNKGVSATDSEDGKVTFTVDDSRVDLTKAGTYYAVYTARDSANNTATHRRKVTVTHDEKDTQALVVSIAAKLSSDPEAIRDYVRKSIAYSHSWGGDDPVWYGFKNKSGNCYVHALCLRALLREKGYSTRLIWTTCKTHYWLIVNIGGTWKHIDATPGVRHTKYSLMNDAQRYECLQGRDWDRSAWPACG